MPSRQSLLALAAAVLASMGADDPKPAPAPLAPERAPSRMTIPPGFSVKPFAAEPDVVQPIAFTIDPRGRLWVVENYSYPIWREGPTGKDRILIFEDADVDTLFELGR